MRYSKLQPILEARGLDVMGNRGKQVLKKLNSSGMIESNLIRRHKFYSLEEVSRFLENNPNFTWNNQKVN